MGEQTDNFTAKLNRLFKEKRKPDGAEYTQMDVINSARGVINRVYLWKLLTGRATNPGIQVVQALADIFQVDPNYFFDKAESSEVVKGDQKPKQYVDQIMMRSSALDENARKAVLNVINIIADLENKD